MSWQAYSIGLGKIKVYSFLNEPFSAEVEVLGANEVVANEMVAELATANDFLRAGIARPFFLTKLKFTPFTHNDKSYIYISSAESVLDPYLDFLVQLSWKEGKMVKGYTVLIDPAPKASKGKRKQPVFANYEKITKTLAFGDVNPANNNVPKKRPKPKSNKFTDLETSDLMPQFITTDAPVADEPKPEVTTAEPIIEQKQTQTEVKEFEHDFEQLLEDHAKSQQEKPKSKLLDSIITAFESEQKVKPQSDLPEKMPEKMPEKIPEVKSTPTDPVVVEKAEKPKSDKLEKLNDTIKNFKVNIDKQANKKPQKPVEITKIKPAKESMLDKFRFELLATLLLVAITFLGILKYLKSKRDNSASLQDLYDSTQEKLKAAAGTVEVESVEPGVDDAVDFNVADEMEAMESDVSMSIDSDPRSITEQADAELAELDNLISIDDDLFDNLDGDLDNTDLDLRENKNYDTDNTTEQLQDLQSAAEAATGDMRSVQIEIADDVIASPDVSEEIQVMEFEDTAGVEPETAELDSLELTEAIIEDDLDTSLLDDTVEPIDDDLGDSVLDDTVESVDDDEPLKFESFSDGGLETDDDLTIDFGDVSIEAGDEEEISLPELETSIEPEIEATSDPDFGDLDISIDDDADFDDINMKIDLAKQYISVGDSASAQEVLNEAYARASGDKKQEIEDLLQQL